MTSYATVQELKDWMSVTNPVGKLPDSLYELAISAASAEIDQATSRTFGPPEGEGGLSTRYYTPRFDQYRGRWVVDIDDLADDDDLVFYYDSAGDGTYATSVELTFSNFAPINTDTVFTQIVLPSGTSLTTAENYVKIIGQFGWAEVPDTIKLACLMQAGRNLDRMHSRLGVAGSPDAGFGEIRLLSALDPDVRLLLKTKMRYWAARSVDFPVYPRHFGGTWTQAGY